MIGRALVAVGFVFAASAAGCGLTDVGKPLSVELTADPMTASVGDTISFVVSGTGSFIGAFVIDFGEEGVEDRELPAGGQSAMSSARHAYGNAGTYRAVGTVFDSSGQLSDTVEVVIEGG